MTSRTVLPLLIISSALAAAPASPVAASETPRVAGQVMAVAGPVTVGRADVVPHPIKFRDNLYWRDVVEARKDGIARVLLGGKATVTVRELSRLELREERKPQGVDYVAELVSGKIRASVARMLMSPGERMEVWTFNTVASVRGTDFIVETAARPAQPSPFGLLAVRDAAQAVGADAGASRETVVVTLSGLVAVSNPLAGTGRAEQVGAFEAVRVSGAQDPVRFQLTPEQLKAYLSGLTPPRPQEARSGDQAEAVGGKVEQVALGSTAQSLPASGSLAAQVSTRGNGLALGHSQSQGNGNGLALGHSDLSTKVGKSKK